MVFGCGFQKWCTKSNYLLSFDIGLEQIGASKVFSLLPILEIIYAKIYPNEVTVWICGVTYL